MAGARLGGLSIDVIAAGLLLAAFILFLTRNPRSLTLVLMVSLILPYGLARVKIPAVVFYTDTSGGQTAFTFTSMVLLLCFLAVVSSDRFALGRIVGTPPGVALIVIGASAFLVQSAHLGLSAGFGLALVRAFQPFEILTVFCWVARQPGGIRRGMSLLAGTMALAVVARYAITFLFGPSDTIDPRLGGRVGFIGSYTIYGTMLVAASLLSIALLATPRGLNERLLWLAVGLLTLSEMVLTKTRGAYLGLVGLVVYLVRSGSRRWVAVFAIVAILAGVLFGFRLATTSGRVVTLNVHTMLSERNTTIRFERNKAALSYIVHHPFDGLALGRPFVYDGAEIGSWVYNPYLAWGVAAGILALLAFAVLMGWSLVRATKTMRRASGDSRILFAGLLAALVAWLVNQWTTGDSLTYLQRPEAGLFFYALIGIIAGSQIRQAQVGFESPMSLSDSGN
jgi:O-antigen ligase